MELTNKRNMVRIAGQARLASGFIDRAVGLMFKHKMEHFDGLLLYPCQSIHTCFMNFDIDVMYIGSDYKIVKIVRHLKPWRVTGIYFKAKMVL